ncbi:LPS assembly lipoprotein LptE [Brachymonas denitrificans]|uniref:LPS-assembly lipoprotein LptE n=1 Tax=Brachymonas denitrificans TaxID=28220 RepID=UPI0032204FFF
MQRRQMLFLGLGSGVGLMASGCGFRLRGSNLQLPFRSVHVQGSNGPLQALLRRTLAGYATVAETPEAAEAVLHVLSERQEQASVVLSTSGKVREVQLRQYVDFSLTDNAGATLVDRSSLRIVRDVSYNESEALSKEAEFELLYRDMRNDAVQQIIRRLAAAKPR